MKTVSDCVEEVRKSELKVLKIDGVELMDLKERDTVGLIPINGQELTPGSYVHMRLDVLVSR